MDQATSISYILTSQTTLINTGIEVLWSLKDDPQIIVGLTDKYREEVILNLLVGLLSAERRWTIIFQNLLVSPIKYFAPSVLTNYLLFLDTTGTSSFGLFNRLFVSLDVLSTTHHSLHETWSSLERSLQFTAGRSAKQMDLNNVGF